ncbi:hypothetical protein ACIQVL_51175 [Streptomyces sp. NPDC090499]|uniref:hypothetical protein n=1 Tax=Streptomyces sp. NPDC090499 TaxID=3365965 RepID=UPI00382C92CA
MKILVEALPELLGALGSTGIISTVAWCIGRRRSSCQSAASLELSAEQKPGTQYQAIRRYTLLGTAGREGEPIQVMSTRPAGSVLLWPVGSRQERFELTDARLYDGTFAAEPVAWFEKIR